MLTGDNQGTAHGVASQLGMDECYHGSCQRQSGKVDELVQIYGHVAMVVMGLTMLLHWQEPT
jgi:cation transport ATPase